MVGFTSRAALVAFALAANAPAVVAQELSSQRESRATNYRLVTGGVFDSQSKPVAGAVVQVAGSTVSASTDRIGRFQVLTYASGAPVLVITAPGFISQELELTDNGFSSVTAVLATAPVDLERFSG